MYGEVSSMKKNENEQDFRAKFVKDGKVTWRVYVISIPLAVVAISLEHWYPGISRPIGASGAALVGTVITKHRYWGFRWFWITLVLLTALQFPLMVLAKPLLDYLKFLFMWVLAFVDLLAIGLVIEIVAGRFEGDVS